MCGQQTVGGIAPGGLLSLPFQVKGWFHVAAVEPGRGDQAEPASGQRAGQRRPGDGQLGLLGGHLVEGSQDTGQILEAVYRHGNLHLCWASRLPERLQGLMC